MMAAESGDGSTDAAGGGAATGGASRRPEHETAERARDAVDHLQAAARELIAAARAALDAADDLVNDRDAMAAVAKTITSLGDLVRPVARRDPWADEPGDQRSGPRAASPSGAENPAGDERIQRIEVR